MDLLKIFFNLLCVQYFFHKIVSELLLVNCDVCVLYYFLFILMGKFILIDRSELSTILFISICKLLKLILPFIFFKIKKSIKDGEIILHIACLCFSLTVVCTYEWILSNQSILRIHMSFFIFIVLFLHPLQKINLRNKQVISLQWVLLMLINLL